MHSTLDLFKTYMTNTLPVIGIIYFSMLVYIQKSILLHRSEFLEFSTNVSNRRSSGQLIASRFNRKQYLGRDTSYLGVILYNQLDIKIKEITNLEKFKMEVKNI